MSTSDAEAFLQRLEDDEEFSRQLREVSGDSDLTHQRAVEAGYDFSSDEMVDALSNLYGVELTQEQLEEIAAGGDAGTLLLGASATTPLSGTVVMGAAAS